MPHRHTFRNFAHRSWVKWDLSKRDFFRKISNPGSQQQVTLSQEYISKIPFQAVASDVKMPKLRKHSSNRGMPCVVYVFGTFRGKLDQADGNPGALLRCMVDMFSNITYREIERLGSLIAPKICQVSLVGCTNNRPNPHSGRKLIFCIPPPIACVHLAVYSTALEVSEAHWVDIEVCLKRKQCPEEPDTWENIPVV